jgi:site-specific DNA recombinase
VRGRDYLGCRRARQRACANRATVRRAPLEERVCEALGRRLMRPDLVAEFVAAFTAEWNRLAAEAEAGLEAHRRELQGVERQLSNLLDALA